MLRDSAHIYELCAFVAPCSVLYRLSSLLVLDMSNTLVRPSHLDLAKIREHKFLPSREDTFVYLGADMEAEEVNALTIQLLSRMLHAFSWNCVNQCQSGESDIKVF